MARRRRIDRWWEREHSWARRYGGERLMRACFRASVTNHVEVYEAMIEIGEEIPREHLNASITGGEAREYFFVKERERDRLWRRAFRASVPTVRAS